MFQCLFEEFYHIPLRDLSVTEETVTPADQYFAMEWFCLPAIFCLLAGEGLNEMYKALARIKSAVKDDPPKYLKIGYSLRCPDIYRKAFIHCVG